MVRGSWFLPESVGGEACSCQDSREGGVQTFSSLASTVLSGARDWGLHARDTNSPMVGKRLLCFVSLLLWTKKRRAATHSG